MLLLVLTTSIILGILTTAITWWGMSEHTSVHHVISQFVLFNTHISNWCNIQDLCLTYQEYSHLQDVQDRISWLYLVLPLLVCITFQRNIIKVSRIDKTLLAIIIVSLLIIINNFEFTFTILHLLIFPQGNWSFPYDSLLIQTYPLSSWLKISIFSAILASLFFISYLTKHRIWRSIKI